MLTISKISSEGSSYYGKDNYYTKGEEEAGQWFGKGAKQLGLEGAVDNDKFDTMLQGKFDGIELGKGKDGTLNHHPGWDHTFSAPKSVSLLALVAKDERLIQAHDKAVNFALHYIEDNLAESRFRRGEAIETQKTGNIVAAKFRHDISRDKDPQLHTHAAILNATLGGNGVLRSLDSPVFYEHKMLGGAMYQSMLANLVKEIGYEVEINDNGTFDIKGVDKDLIDKASKRRNSIQEEMKIKGVSGSIAAQYAALATRPEKAELSHQEKRELWQHDFGDKVINQLLEFSQSINTEIKQSYIAPNGKPSNLSHEQYKQVRTSEFKAWFGDWENDPKNASKIVDENGEPLVVYHGTSEKFENFDMSKTNRDLFWFTEDKEFAQEYAYNQGNPEIKTELKLLKERDSHMLEIGFSNGQNTFKIKDIDELYKRYNSDNFMSNYFFEFDGYKTKEELLKESINIENKLNSGRVVETFLNVVNLERNTNFNKAEAKAKNDNVFDGYHDRENNANNYGVKNPKNILILDDIKNKKKEVLGLDKNKQQRLVADEAVTSAIKHLSENQAVFKTIDIAREAIVTSLGKTMPHKIKQAIDAKIKNAELLYAKTTELKSLNGNIKALDKRAYTTPELIQQEKLTIKIMREERQKVTPIVGKDLDLARAEVFTKGQAQAATEILTTKDRFINIQGFAGTGKTFMLEEVKEQATAKGYKVIGMAPSAAAANVLSKDTGIEAKTVQKHLMEGLQSLNRPKQQELVQEPKQKELWLIDESSFISTKQALALAKLATKQDAQVINLGDSKQLAGVESGKPFAISQHKKYGLTTIRMEEIVRQKDIDLRQAVYSATKGDITTAFSKIDKNIVQIQDKEGKDEPILRREIIADTYLSMDNKQRNDTLVISPANEDRFDVNNHIRVGLIEQGELGKKSIKTTNLVSKNLTNEAKTKSYNYHQDAIVRFNRGNKKLGIDKDSYFKVSNINHDNNQLTLVGKDNQEILWNPKKNASKSAEVYFENKRELNQGEVLFWRRAGGTKDAKRRTNEKIKVLKVNKSNQSVKYVDVGTGESKTMRLNDFSNKHWEYAYCLTAHQAQGQTSEKVIINLESWRGKLSNQQAFYVELSRAKQEAIIFTDDKEKIERQLSTKTGEKESALEQVTDKRIFQLSDIVAKQQGLKTSTEIAQEKQQQLKDQTTDYLKKLNPEQFKKLESDFRKTQSPVILKMYDKAHSEKIKQTYQDQIRLYAQENKLEKDQSPDRTNELQKSQEINNQEQIKQQEIKQTQMEMAR